MASGFLDSHNIASKLLNKHGMILHAPELMYALVVFSKFLLQERMSLILSLAST